MQVTNWQPLRFWGLRGDGTNFIDISQVIQWSNCYKNYGWQIYESTGACSGYIYGSTLIHILSPIATVSNLTIVLGYLFIPLISFQLGYITKKVIRRDLIPFSFAIFFSPPFMLLIERGNLDLIIFSLSVISLIMFHKEKYIISWIFICFTALLKFYTLPILFVFLLFKSGKKFFYGVFSFCAALIIFSDLIRIQSAFPTGSSWKFGMSIWVRYFPENRAPSNLEFISNSVGLIVFSTIALLINYFFKLEIFNSKVFVYQRHTFLLKLFYLSTATHLFCFVIGMNFDYRLIFLAVSGLTILSMEKYKSELYAYTKLLLVASMWLSYPSGGLQLIGDISITILSGVLLIEFFKVNNLLWKSRNE